jgi:hypothetical protein
MGRPSCCTSRHSRQQQPEPAARHCQFFHNGWRIQELLADSIGITSKANSETTIQQHQYNHSEISATLLAIPLAGYATDEAWIQILRHREFTHGGFCNDLAS